MTALIENWVEYLYNRGLLTVGVEDNNGQGASYLFIKLPNSYKTAKELARFLQMEANTPETFMLNVLPDGDNWENTKYEIYYKEETKGTGKAGDVLFLRVLLGDTEAYHVEVVPVSDDNPSGYGLAVLDDLDYIGMAEGEESDWHPYEDQDRDYVAVVPEWVVEVKGKGRFLYGFIGKDEQVVRDFDKAKKFVTRKRAEEYIAREYPDTVDLTRSKARKVYYYEGTL